MKRRFAVVLSSVLCIALLLTGCGAEEKEDRDKESSRKKTEETANPQETFTEPQPEDETGTEGQETEKTETEEAEGSETPEEIPEEAANTGSDSNSFLFKIDNPVIYDAEGVTVTMDDWSLENDGIYLTFTIANNNPDNKKVKFDAMIDLDGLSYLSLSTRDLLSGDSTTETVGADFSHYLQFKETIDAGSFPLASLSLYYLIQIGSNSEVMTGHTTFKNPEYTAEVFSQVYGEKIGECEFIRNGYNYDLDAPIDNINCKIEVYQKRTQNNNMLFTIKRVDDTPVDYFSNSIFLPSIEFFFFEGVLGVSPKSQISGFTVLPDGGMICYVYDMDDIDLENIRRKNEIANDVSPEVYISLRYYDIWYGWQVVTIPVSLE